MAMVIEDARFPISDEAAERMVENGLLVKCGKEHTCAIEGNQAVYHIAEDAPVWFGYATLAGAIRSAEEYVNTHPA